MRTLLLSLGTLLLWAAPGLAEVATAGGHGRILALASNGEWLEVETHLAIPQPGWKRLPGQSDARDVKAWLEGARRCWSGAIDVDRGKSCRFRENLEESGGVVHLTFEITPETDVETEGVFLFLDVPRSVFAGGRCDLTRDNAPVAGAEMPRERPAERHFLSGDANRLTLADAPGRTRLEVSLDRAVRATVQDTREWQGSTYTAFFLLAPGPLRQGQTVTASVDLKLAVQPDRQPAHLTLDATRKRYHLDGFGGDYCFNIESPVTQYTLDHLNLAWARTEMSLAEWAPERPPAGTDWESLRSHDQPGTRLRREFLLAQQLQRRGVPQVISIWYLPEWIYAPPGKASRRIAPEKWPELLECLGSYLSYARKQYGVEPDLFCFNEPNLGVYAIFTPEEHREAILRIGAYFHQLGLKTKMLLGDATGPRGTHTYVLPAAADPEAMQYVGAVAFHSWGGGTPEQYSAWGDVAERLKLPLLVTELGVDAAAWKTDTYHSFHYALQEVQMYQELLLYARPQGTMQWEFTADYSTVNQEPDAAGGVKLTPTVRFWFVKHFCNLTPHGADALGTASDHPKVLFTAFAGAGPTRRVFTLHIANLGAERPATLEGLPKSIRRLRAVRTSETEGFRELDRAEPKNGALDLTLAPLSLLTLTTLPGD